MKTRFFLLLVMCFVYVFSYSQDNLHIKLIDGHSHKMLSDSIPIFINGKLLFFDKKSKLYIFSTSKKKVKIHIYSKSYRELDTSLAFSKDVITFYLFPEDGHRLEDIEVVAPRNTWTVGLLNSTEGTSIYAGKKNELIHVNNIQANTATNNARQIFAKIPGVNLIENDEAGIQLSVATRGLNPNRTTEFNSRQNGYDISADPIGYAESYYTPPMDGVQDIEIIRGAASLQYGTQFGGLLNFKIKEAPKEKRFEFVAKQTGGSYGFFNSFNSVAGRSDKLSYYGFYNFRRGDGWRQNTRFHIHNGYWNMNYDLSSKIKLGIEYTFMDYKMKQPGGLTDAEFTSNPKASYRNRNWFAAQWNLPVLNLQYQISSNDLLSVKSYVLVANRKNVGVLSPITEVDDGKSPRTVMNDQYRNFYTEARFMHHYKLFNDQISSLLIGGRYYHGNTHRIQGWNYSGSDANFNIDDPQKAQIDYKFPSHNIAFFAENVFQISPKLSITPGVRYESIRTNANGFTYDSTSGYAYGKERHPRNFALLGLGIEYKVAETTDVYANISQNFSPVSFTDIIIVQPSMNVDPNIKDVKGYNAEIGYRGNLWQFLTFDVNAYYLMYKNRVGLMYQCDGDMNVYLYQTNISDSRSMGTELYGELNLLKLVNFKDQKNYKFSFFTSAAYTNAKYIHTDSPDRLKFKNKDVEYAPKWIYRIGMNAQVKKFAGSIQYAYTSFQFSDATNSINSFDGTVGTIPSYGVLDGSLSYSFHCLILQFSANNILNKMYFTRRTTGFPGPGIIPSIGSNYYVTIGIHL